MNPQQVKTTTTDYPTSPWTETYQAAPHHQAEQADGAPVSQRCFDQEDQQPTHDALSDIYNRGY